MKNTGFCRRLEDAVQDEDAASREYGELIESAKDAGMDAEASAIKRIQVNEKTHQSFFTHLYEDSCKEEQ